MAPHDPPPAPEREARPAGNRAARLTESQLACVRLVGTGPSKAIAKRLGISHHTVDDHIKQAMRILGAASRYEAAEMVAAWEAGTGALPAHPQDLGAQSPPLAEPGDPAILNPSYQPPAVEQGGNRVNDAAAAFPAKAPAPPPAARLGPIEEARNALTPFQVLTRILAVALAIAILAAAAVSIGNGFNSLGRFVQQYLRPQ
jgi:DNA-binding CsgD family transcriptional regulator